MSRSSFAAKSYRTDALVLRTYKLGEADRIVVLLSPQFGQIRAVAKGVRRTKSKLGARLEPFSNVDLQLVHGRSLDHISQVESHRTYGQFVVQDYARYTCAIAVTELAEKLTSVDTQDARDHYDLALGAVAALARDAYPPQLILDSYLLRAMATSGWRISLDACALCLKQSVHYSFAPALGGLVCHEHRLPGATVLTAETLELLRALLGGDWGTAVRATANSRASAAGMIAAFVQFHVERSLRSLTLVERA